MAYTEEQYAQLRANARHNLSLPKKPSKYRNVVTVIDGERFDSNREAEAYLHLQSRERAGEIRDLKRQVPFDLFAPVMTGATAIVVVATYIADFTYDELQDGQWRLIVADVKGGKATQTALFKLKAKWLTLQSGITIQIL